MEHCPTKSFVFEQRCNIGVTGKEHLVPDLIVENWHLSAQLFQLSVGVRNEIGLVNISMMGRGLHILWRIKSTLFEYVMFSADTSSSNFVSDGTSASHSSKKELKTAVSSALAMLIRSRV